MSSAVTSNRIVEAQRSDSCGKAGMKQAGVMEGCSPSLHTCGCLHAVAPLKKALKEPCLGQSKESGRFST